MPKPPNIQLVNASIRSLNFKAKDGRGKEEIAVTFNISSGYEYDYRKKQVIITIRVSVNQVEMPFALDIEYQGLFSLNKSVARKVIEPFARVNCPAILFPFLRECIADLTRRAGFPPLMLPAINFVELAKKQGEDNGKKPDSK